MPEHEPPTTIYTTTAGDYHWLRHVTTTTRATYPPCVADRKTQPGREPTLRERLAHRSPREG